MVSARAISYLPGLRSGNADARRGVLPSQQVRGLVRDHHVAATAPVEDSQIQPASLDLRLGPRAYQVRASFLPGRRSKVMQVADEFVVQELDLANSQVLLKGAVYIIPLLESLELPVGLAAKANPKSTTGRLDVFSRLITDGADQFDSVERGYKGQLYLEVAPKTFSIRVRQGTRLNQLRFISRIASFADSSQKAARAGEALLFSEQGEPLKASVMRGVWLTVDLGEGGGMVGWKARQHSPVVDFDETGHYEPRDFWEEVYPNRGGQVILSPGEFYILGSRERVRVPATYAAEMVPYDPGMGEFRAHYAGFFDPGFGYGRGELPGTRAILEVRSHEVPYVLRDGQHIARLIYQPLAETPDKLYGVNVTSSYQDQRQGLGKQFRSGPAPG